MPAYNAERTIIKSVNSVINQTYQEWELIIINDFSTDSTSKIIKDMAKKEKRIKYIENKENMGVSKARNKGMKYSKYETLAFIDSDDIWHDNKLEEQVKLMNDFGAKFVFTGADYINEEGIPYAGTFLAPLKVDYKKLRHQNVISTSSVVIEKNILGNLKFKNDKIHEDYALWLKILKKGNNAHGIKEPLITYRLYKNSKSGNKINSVKMTFGVFKEIGLNNIQSVLFTISHLSNATRKYRKILIDKG